MKLKRFSFMRLWAMIVKEFIEMRRDVGTLAIMVIIPFMQVILFGYAINNDPKHLPTAIVQADNSQFVRTFIQGMQNSGYFVIEKKLTTEQQAEIALAKGDVLFVLNIPPNFTRDLVQGKRPSLLVQADAVDPSVIDNAIAALNILAQNVFQYDFSGNLHYLQPNIAAPVNIIVHRQYNPEQVTQYNIVIGLLGIVLTMTLTMITAISITRERDHGTMESLLSTPLHPLEIILGKIIPYIIIGYVQMSLILLIGKVLFGVPIIGSLLLLFLLSLPFVAANLAVGITISTIATKPLQAVQMAIFFFIPSLLLSGFMFPFKGMPQWAQWVGDLLPLTHYLRIARGILVKGNDFSLMAPEILAILAFLLFMTLIGLRKFQKTLD